ncbi:hypothetical protein A359_01560 [secondary endosymbiont of Ctenarytaina eucalypti]|uniref:Uncharacterized protein n=1 Tax=secondary endosymbiont of Ctenarytaina eucalypti TaxID=1199245 RepID=J3Z2X3_9ENTR|nr:hypothetical protein A359_01560 [secondary endosymbiont of Ctenarytaina eucalypti]
MPVKSRRRLRDSFFLDHQEIRLTLWVSDDLVNTYDSVIYKCQKCIDRIDIFSLLTKNFFISQTLMLRRFKTFSKVGSLEVMFIPYLIEKSMMFFKVTSSGVDMN